MKTMRFLALALTFLTVNVAFAANEIHWTVTGQNSVTFNWRGTTTEKTIGYGLTSGVYTTVTAKTPNPVPVSSRGPFWEAKLTGLTANTRYFYKIGTGPERSFRTPPSPGGSDFNVYALGNIGSTSTYFNTGVVQDIIANDLPSFVVGLGDLTLGSNNGKATIDQHFNDVMVWSKNAAYMPVWGDMDTISSSNENFKNYKGRFAVPNPQTSPGSPLAGGEDWYWFDYGNVRFITTPEPWTGAWVDWKTKAGALMAGAQADSNIKFIVTFVHRPAYSSGHSTGSSALKGILDTLGDTYSKYKLNVSGHSNNYERSLPQHGVIHVTAGTGGANLGQDGTCLWLTCTKPPWSAFRAMHLGALKLRFTSSSIEGSFICGPAGGGTNDVTCTKGSVVDKFVIGAPLISAVSAFNITQTGAEITWTVSEPATGQVEYGTTTSYGQLSTKETSFNYTTHQQQLSGLAPGTQYHFRTRSSNQTGVESVSGDFTFTTVPTTNAINVKNYGATGNDSTDDTSAIQAAINATPSGGTVYVPNGTYMIDALTHLNLKSNMTLQMESGAILKAIPNNNPVYNIVTIRNVSNVKVIGGTVQGERNKHTDISQPGDWNQEGMGIGIYESHHILIDGVTAKDCWGDGFFIGEWGNSTTNVTIQNAIADNNRRQGLSIVSADGVIVRNSVFKNTHGIPPMAGIDVEANENQTVNNVQILNNEVYGNQHNGIQVFRGNPANGANQTNSNVTIGGNNIHNNGSTNESWWAGVWFSEAVGVTLTENNIHDNVNAGEGIAVIANSTGNIITNNTVTNGGGAGIYISDVSTGNTLTGNTITGNPNGNIVAIGGNNISMNTTN